jgi:hypothetical protein
VSVFCRSGGGLLFRGLSLSIMGAGAFHGRVRDGIGCRRSALEPPDRRKTDVGCQMSDISGAECVIARGVF